MRWSKGIVDAGEKAGWETVDFRKMGGLVIAGVLMALVTWV